MGAFVEQPFCETARGFCYLRLAGHLQRLALACSWPLPSSLQLALELALAPGEPLLYSQKALQLLQWASEHHSFGFDPEDLEALAPVLLLPVAV